MSGSLRLWPGTMSVSTTLWPLASHHSWMSRSCSGMLILSTCCWLETASHLITRAIEYCCIASAQPNLNQTYTLGNLDENRTTVLTCLVHSEPMVTLCTKMKRWVPHYFKKCPENAYKQLKY